MLSPRPLLLFVSFLSPRRAIGVLVATVLTLSGWRSEGAAGDFDPRWGGAGKVLTSVDGELGSANGVVVQPDGKVVVAGWAAPEEPQESVMAVMRYLTNGTLDATFNGTGKVTTHIHQSGGGGRKLALQPDGKIVVAGYAGMISPMSMVVVRYLPDGTLDTSFNGTGKLIVNPGPRSAAHAVAIQDDGKILIAGGSGIGDQWFHFTLLRFLPDGTPDPSFNGNGTVVTPLTNGMDTIRSMVLQKDGRIVVAGISNYHDEEANLLTADMAVARYLPDGRLDPDFNGTGFVLARMGLGVSGANTVALQEDGKIVVGGYAIGGTEHPGRHSALLRLDAQGKRDPPFNGTGEILYELGSSFDEIFDLTVDRTGRIVAVGEMLDNGGGNARSTVLCVLPDGGLDSSFKGTGFVITDFDEGRRSACNAVALEREGTVVTAGWASADTSKFALARYQLWSGHPAVEYPERTLLTHGSTVPVDFGLVTAGSHSREFIIRNPRAAPLTGLTVLVNGASHPGEFTFSQPGAATLTPGGTTTFVVTFTPSAAAGLHTAMLHVSGNDGAPQSFSIPIAGTRATASQVWRYTWFGSPDNSGPGADLNDFDGDGMVNLLEYAMGGHPHQFTPFPEAVVKNGGVMEFTYSRAVAAVTELDYRPEWAVSPAGPWSAAGITSAVVSDDGVVQTVRANVPAPGGRAFVRLQVTRR